MAISWNVIEEVAATAAARGIAIEYQTLPVIEYGGFFWDCDGRTVVVGPVNRVAVYKSADRITWTQQDAGVGPIMHEANAFYPGTGNTIYFSYWIDSTTEICLVTFNMDTGLFGTPVTGGPNFTGSTPPQPNIWNVRLSNGDQWVFYHSGVGVGFNSIYAVKYDGSWAAPLLVALGTNGNINNNYKGVCIDSGDRTYLFFARRLAGSSRRQMYLNTLLAGALSGEQQISDRPGSSLGLSSTPIASAADGKVYWVWNVSFTGVNTSVALITVDTGTLVPTVTDVADPTDPNDIWYFTCVARRANGELWAFVYNENFIDGVTSILYFVDSGSGFGSEQVYWDDSIDPIASPYVPEVNSITALFITSGDLVVSLGGASSDTPLCDIRYVSTQSLSPIALALACPSSGSTATVGVAYDKTLDITGGTPPYTVTVTGLPPGLTLNATTGKITGIPTMTGSFFPSYTVTDSLGSTVGPLVCPITVRTAAGGCIAHSLLP